MRHTLGIGFAGQIAEQGDELRIMVAAEGAAPYQKVLDAMDVLRRAKVSNVSLMTNAGGNAR